MKSLLALLIIAIFAQIIYCEACHEGWRSYEDDEYFYCKPPKGNNYGRGGGYGLRLGESNLKQAKKRCENAHPDLGCEKWGLVYYPKCLDGYHNNGCCFCDADCPKGYIDFYPSSPFANAMNCSKEK